MEISKRLIRNTARGYNLDSDELLLILWDEGEKYKYLKNENSIIKTKDVKSVKEIARAKLKSKSDTAPKKLFKSQTLVCQTYDFGKTGRKLETISYLTEEEVRAIYDELVSDFASDNDPISPYGVKDEELLKMAIYHPQTSYEGVKKYPTAEAGAAALMYALTHNHAFYNGNKRISIVCMLTMLDQHNLMMLCDQDDLFRVSLELAKHRLVKTEAFCTDDEIFALAVWISKHTRPIIKGEQVITLRKLKQILNEFNCSILENGKVERRMKTKNFLGLERTQKICSTSIISSSISEGREVERHLIKNLRKELKLDEENGVDSDVFYGKYYHYNTSDFINKYKVLLRRLSKV